MRLYFQLFDACEVKLELRDDEWFPGRKTFTVESTVRHRGEDYVSQHSFDEDEIAQYREVLVRGVESALLEVFREAVVEPMKEQFKDEYTALAQQNGFRLP